jgi:hypothetical protein
MEPDFFLPLQSQMLHEGFLTPGLAMSFMLLLEDSMTHNLPATLEGLAPDALPLAT